MSRYSGPPPTYPGPPQTEIFSAIEAANAAMAAVSIESQSDLVIGIDFGTTFTGVAYAHIADTPFEVTTTSDMRRIADKVFVIKSWPSQGNQFAEKTPTVLAYDTNPPGWGANIRLKAEPRIAHFKLGLQENIGRHYRNGALRGTTNSPEATDSSVLGGYLNDHNWKHPSLPEKTALDYTADFLTRIRRYVLDEVLPSRYGARFLENQQMSYVITVPAIWSEKAKSLTHLAALRAGIPHKKLTLITEPEAAALYCATLCTDVNLKQGDRFLICDAGGGTVDLIAYKIITLTPFSVEECSVGTGAACGSIYLDLGFEKLMRKKFQHPRLKSFLNAKHLAELVRQFETSIKRRYNPYDASCDNEFEIPVGAMVPDMPEVGIEDGYLKISSEEIGGIFDPILNQISRRVQEQARVIKKTYRNELKTIFLVGGLGSNRYLSKFLESKMKDLIDVKQPETGYSAIMRGAVLYKLGLDFVKHRVMRHSYGIKAAPIFLPGHHREENKYVDLAGDIRCHDVMSCQGQKVASGTVIDHSFHWCISPAEYVAKGPINRRVTLFANDGHSPPEYVDMPGIKKHCTLRANLRGAADLDDKAFKTLKGPEGEYHRVNYEIGMIFGPGGIEFQLLYEGTVVSSVDCDYY